MDDLLKPFGASERWKLLVSAAKLALVEAGYTIERMPGRGLSNTWTVEKSGKKQTLSIRTSRDRYVAFPPLKGGTKYKTLDDVELVAVAAVDNQQAPQKVEVYLLPAPEVRKRFDAAYAARKKEGHVLRDNFGMWVALDDDNLAMPYSAGAGIAKKYPPIASYAIAQLVASSAASDTSIDNDEPAIEEAEHPRPKSIADVMAWAREQVAQIAGVRIEAVKLDLKVEY